MPGIANLFVKDVALTEAGPGAAFGRFGALRPPPPPAPAPLRRRSSLLPNWRIWFIASRLFTPMASMHMTVAQGQHAIRAAGNQPQVVRRHQNRYAYAVKLLKQA